METKKQSRTYLISALWKNHSKLLSVMGNKELLVVFFPPQCANKVFAEFWLFLSLPVEMQVIKIAVFYNRENKTYGAQLCLGEKML